MGYTCNKPAGSCTTCEHFRFDEDKQDNACFATVDAFAEGADYELAFYKQVDIFKKMCGLPSDAIGIAIRAKNGYTDDWGLPEYSVITVNIPGPFGEPELIGMVNCAYMDINNSGRLIEELKKLRFNGNPVVKDTGFNKRSGFVEYPLFQFDENWLRSLPLTYGAFGNYEKYLAQFEEEEETE